MCTNTYNACIYPESAGPAGTSFCEATFFYSSHAYVFGFLYRVPTATHPSMSLSPKYRLYHNALRVSSYAYVFFVYINLSYTSVRCDMHGLIYETSIYLLAGTPRCISSNSHRHRPHSTPTPLSFFLFSACTSQSARYKREKRERAVGRLMPQRCASLGPSSDSQNRILLIPPKRHIAAGGISCTKLYKGVA